jgi:signal transduction histidine kinase/ActR/RegA family two-component response regulator
MGWFAKLPIHQKLMAIALAVTTTALLVAMLGLIVVDLWRYRTTALDETMSTASVIAENTAAAVEFKDAQAARASLETVSVRPAIRRACLYLADGSLFAGFGRSSEFECPPARPTTAPWRIISARAPVTSADRTIATVYVERELTAIWTTIAVTVFSGLVILLLAAAAAFVIAHRLHRSVSAPIAELAAAAKRIRPDGTTDALPDIRAGDDEIGELVGSFSAMLHRVQEANASLVESNERLRRQEAEREELLAREREASRLKDEFLAAVSHELRTPLNAIVGWIQILTTTTASAQTTEKALASIARNAKAQTRVIEDLVDVSRIVTGKLNLRFDPVDLREVADTAADAIKPAAHAKGVAVTTNLTRDACFVNGDRDRVQQIIWNLLSNAVKFTPAGGAVTLNLRTRERICELAVTDTGIGIAPSFLPNVFDRFRQADGSMTREHGGLGLGLAIVKELVELHGGSVVAESRGQGQGATFRVRLPQLAGFDAAEPAPEAPHALAAHTLDGVHVLAVDDNADALDLVAASLAGTGARVTTASSGEEALRQWDRDPADVLVCDLAMPQMDGFDVLRGIRDRDAAAGRLTPAIALTAHMSQSHVAHTRDAGFEFHVGKPFEASELVHTILAALSREEHRP